MHQPMSLFKALLEKANGTDLYPTAMNIATVNPETLMPNSRTVLLRRVTEANTLEFFTSYISPKAMDIEKNPNVSVCFFWPNLYHQVVMQGSIEKCDRAISEAYFESREKGKQIASYTSDQSQPVDSYEAYLEKYEANVRAFEHKPVGCPEDWGGYHITPHRIEIWKGSQMRIHERHEYWFEDANWEIRVLQP